MNTRQKTILRSSKFPFLLFFLFFLPSLLFAQVGIEATLSTADGSDYFRVLDNASTVLMTTNSDGKVGIGTTTPTQKLEISGGMRLNTATVQPACSATTRGTFWFTQGGAGIKDSVAVCAKDAVNAYAWRVIY